MPIQQFYRINENRAINAHAYTMNLHVGASMAKQIRCGQFLHIKCSDAMLLRRPISISDWDEDSVQLVYEIRGEGTKWLSQRRVGESLDILGPLGRGFDVTGRKVLLVGGGIGVPPLLSCARTMSLVGSEVHAAFGFRNLAHQMLTDCFAPFCKSLWVISDDGTTGIQGLVTDLVQAQLSKQKHFDAILACGPRGMLKEVSRLALEANIPCQVSLEERMGCGVGACLVCACQSSDGRMLHVCKDGPVFRALEVDWND